MKLHNLQDCKSQNDPNSVLFNSVRTMACVYLLSLTLRLTLSKPVLEVEKVHPISFYDRMVSRCMAIYHILFSYSLIDGPLGSSHILATMNNAAVNIHIKVLCGHMFLILLSILHT